MAGQKRTRTGDPKPASTPQAQQQEATAMTDTPPCGQAQAQAQAQPKHSRIKAAPWNTFNAAIHGAPKPPGQRTATSHADAVEKNKAARRKYHERRNASKATANNGTKPATTTNNPNTATNSNQRIHKRPLLPANATLTKRPLLHPALPSPFSSAANPKVLYITASSAFIPACKRIRSLLGQIAKRRAQAEGSAGSGRGKRGAQRREGGARALEANGRLEARDVEARIAASASAAAVAVSHGKGTQQGGGAAGDGVGDEQVYLKATGRAIPRALELGVRFQREDDCRVRVEMGNVKAIDDVEVRPRVDDGRENQDDGEETHEDVEEVPETRIRTLSTVTVCIGLV